MPGLSISYAYLKSPIGPLLLAGDAERLRMISFPSGRGVRKPQPGWRKDAAPLAEAMRQLREYFAGARTEFKLPLHFEGSPFQTTVWRALQEIPYGETVSYGEIARRIGEPPSSSRAVGAANGANPLPIVVPCHRVIGADGSLTGFGGGLPTKSFLLALEQRVKPPAGLQYSLFG
jgi:methylated-DNA-[protein]-cysteine S-methyltransferase